jgi:DNA-binding NarL/FixJ family response regulator
LRTAFCAEPNFSIVDVTANDSAAAVATKSDDTDILLVDLDTSGEHGIDIVTRLRRQNDKLRIVAISDLEDPELAVAAARAGVSSWVPKRLGLRYLVWVIKRALAGESWFPPALLGPVLAGLTRQEPSPDASRIAHLTVRERQILMFMVEGLDRQAIARLLCLSTNTVRTHIQNILGKLGAHSGLEAIAIAMHAGTARQATTVSRKTRRHLVETGSEKVP